MDLVIPLIVAKKRRQVHTIEAIPHFFVHSTSILAFRPYADLIARAYAVSASRKLQQTGRLASLSEHV